jgi:acyl-homoserine-lactone acylase
MRGSRSLTFAPLALLVLTSCAHMPGVGPDEGRTVVYRDNWGVPHIYAPSTMAGAYAMGWAQAQDRPEQLLKNYLRAIGQAASVEGSAAVQSDLIAHLWENYAVARRNADRISTRSRVLIRQFVRGVNDFYAAHPGDRPEWWGDRQVDEFMVIAFARFFLYSWSIEDAFQDLARAGIEPGSARAGRGSNQMAIAPERTAEGAAILVIDPHLAWWGPSRFWEFRIHAGDLVGSGFTLPGFPAIGLGHNRHLAWAMTTGGPDTADIYELTLNPDDPTQYRFDGDWRSLTSRTLTLKIAGEPDRPLTIYDSHLGPIVATRNGRAYAARMAYADEVEVIDAWYALNLGEDYRAAMSAMDSLQIFPQNVMVADTSGNIYYQRTGRVPRRPAGYDWSRPVDGSTSATDWLGFHPASDHLQALNPPQGYMQNCNVPPDSMIVEGPFSPEGAPAYLYSDRSHGPISGWTNQRGARAVELLERNASFSVEDAIAMVLDRKVYGVERWIAALEQADRAQGAQFSTSPDYARGLGELRQWDGRLEPRSAAALKYVYWREQLARELDEAETALLAAGIDFHQASLGYEPPPLELAAEDLRLLCETFAAAMTRLRAERGMDAVYGDVFRVGRGDRSWPVGGGGDRDLGLVTLRNIGFGEPRENGERWGERGQTATQVVVLTQPVRSWSASPIGQSDRPGSPHFDDQAERLLSRGRLKPTAWLPDELRKQIASREVLKGAP